MTGTRKSDLVELTLHHHLSTEKAALVSDTGVHADAVWLPLSQIEMVPLSQAGGKVEVTLPEWLAKKKRLI